MKRLTQYATQAALPKPTEKQSFCCMDDCVSFDVQLLGGYTYSV